MPNINMDKFFNSKKAPKLEDLEANIENMFNSMFKDPFFAKNK